MRFSLNITLEIEKEVIVSLVKQIKIKWINILNFLKKCLF